MIYLALSIIFMTLLAIVIRLGVAKGVNALGMNMAFRCSAGVIMLVVMAGTVPLSRLAEVWAIAGSTAIVASFFFWASGFASIKAVEHGRLGVSWTVLRCSMVIPTLASLFYWGEVPLVPVSGTLVARLAGVAVTTTAVILLGIDQAKRRRAGGTPKDGKGRALTWMLWIGTAFFAQGGWEIASRATRSFPDNESRLLFVAVVCVMASLVNIPVMILAKAPLGRKEITYGAMAGVCGVIASGVRLWALRDLDGIIVFPVTTVTVTLLVLLAGAVIWRERTGRWGLAGCAAALAGMALLTVSF